MSYYNGNFHYTCFVYTDYTDYSTTTEYNGKISASGAGTLTIAIADSSASPSALQTNLSIQINGSTLEEHDTIYISNVDKFHFLLGDSKDYYEFPSVRFNTNTLSFTKTTINSATTQSTFNTLSTNVETAITNMNKLFYGQDY